MARPRRGDDRSRPRHGRRPPGRVARLRAPLVRDARPHPHGPPHRRRPHRRRGGVGRGRRVHGQDRAAVTDDRAFLTTAINLAARSAETGGGPFGAVVVTATGGLYPAHNTATATHDPTAHAEVNALRAAGAGEGTNDLTGAVLYSSSEPCPMCLTAALWARVDRLVYAATIDYAATAGFDDSSFYRQIRARSEERRVGKA